VIKENAIQQTVMSAARKVLADVQQRSTEAIKALDQHDFSWRSAHWQDSKSKSGSSRYGSRSCAN
jgi:hypothetical protein